MSTVLSPSQGCVIGRGRGRSSKSEATKLNLVSLMDIFTILVFFLMLNTGEVEVLQPDEKIELPKSFASLRPDASPVIKVNNNTLYFKEQAVATITELQASKELIQPLMQKLEAYHAELKASPQAKDIPLDSISIMGDAALPYALLKKVLYTCAQAGFRDIALAVEYSVKNLKKQPTNSLASRGAST